MPNARRGAIVGWMGDVLKVKLQAPPVDGRANAEMLALLARALALPPAAVTLTTGGAARLKRVRIAGLDAAAVRQRLDRPSPAA